MRRATRLHEGWASRLRGESGAAIVAVLLVMGVVAALGLTITTISVNNLENVGRDRIAGMAFATAEAGVAQALSHIRNAGLSNLRCDDPPVVGTDCTRPWGRDNPHTVSLPGNKQFQVWIQRIQAFAPPDLKVGTYRIHSSGTSGVGPAKRYLALTIQVSPFKYPIGVYADRITDAGDPSIHKESMFSKTCISGRDKMGFEGTDRYWGIPAAAHSTEYISEGVNTACTATTEKNIHYPGPPPPPQSPGVCNTTVNNKGSTYRYDQDKLGGDLVGTPCYNATGYPKTSFFDLTALQKFDYDKPRGLTDSQYAALKAQAQEQGTYFTTNSFPVPAEPPPFPNAVYYFNLKPGGGTVSIQTELNGFGSANCGQRSLILVVEGGDVHINSGADIVGALFVPDGNYRGNGNALITGTLFARTIDKLTGTADFTLEGSSSANCFFDNFPAGMFEITRTRFREVDR